MPLETMRAYEVHWIKDEMGRESWHLAKNKAEAVDAHLMHWGVNSIANTSQHLSMIRTKTNICKDTRCLASVGLTQDRLDSALDKLAP